MREMRLRDSERDEVVQLTGRVVSGKMYEYTEMN